MNLCSPNWFYTNRASDFKVRLVRTRSDVSHWIQEEPRARPAACPPRTFRLLALRSRLVPTEPCPPVRCSDDSTRQQSCNRVRCGIRLKRFPLKTLSRVMQPVGRSEPFHRLARCGRTGRTRGTATPTAILGRKPGWRRHSHTIQCDSSHIGTETCRETISLSGQRMP